MPKLVFFFDLVSLDAHNYAEIKPLIVVKRLVNSITGGKALLAYRASREGLLLLVRDFRTNLGVLQHRRG